MKLQVDQPTLTTAIQKAAMAVTRSAVPILECLRLEGKDNILHITGAGADVTSIARCDAAVSTAGVVVVKCEVLVALISNSSPSPAMLRLDGNSLSYECGPVRASLPTMDARDFPPIHRPEGETEVKECQSALRFCERFAAKNDPREYLNGILLDDKYVVATDGKIMAVVETAGATIRATLPGKHLPIINKSIDQDGRLFIGERTWRIEAEDHHLFGSLIDAEPLSWQRIITRTSDAFTCETDEVLSALSTTPSANVCMITATNNGVSIELTGADSDVNIDIEADTHANGIVCFSIAHLKPALEAMRGSVVRFEYGENQIFITPLGTTGRRVVINPRADARSNWQIAQEAA